MIETYSLTTDCGGSIDNAGFLQTINDNVTITTNCTNVVDEGDVVTIYFESAISAPEKTELDSLVAAYIFSEPEAFIYTRVLKAGCSFTGGVTLAPGTWTLDSGTLTGFNLTLGKFVAPSQGLFSIKLVCELTVLNNTSMNARFKNENNDVLIENNLGVSTISNRCSEKWVEYLMTSEEVIFEGLFAANETCNLEIMIIKIN